MQGMVERMKSMALTCVRVRSSLCDRINVCRFVYPLRFEVTDNIAGVSMVTSMDDEAIIGESFNWLRPPVARECHQDSTLAEL